MLRIFLLNLLIVFVSTIVVTAQPAPDPLTLEKQRADRAVSRLNDFAQLSRYAKANSELAAPANGEKRVVFLGDSITDSWKLEESFPGKPYINRGISGQVTSQMLLRMRPDVIAHKPKVLVLLAGTNDIAGNYGPMSISQITGNIASIVEIAHANGINVVLASVLPISDYNKNRNGETIVRSLQRKPAEILEINNFIKKYCDEKKLVYLDYYSATVDNKGFLRPELAGDGLHPNADGYKIMQKLAAEAIEKALKNKQK